MGLLALDSPSKGLPEFAVADTRHRHLCRVSARPTPALDADDHHDMASR
jgi:hypothetical protein